MYAKQQDHSFTSQFGPTYCVGLCKTDPCWYDLQNDLRHLLQIKFLFLSIAFMIYCRMRYMIHLVTFNKQDLKHHGELKSYLQESSDPHLYKINHIFLVENHSNKDENVIHFYFLLQSLRHFDQFFFFPKRPRLLDKTECNSFLYCRFKKPN